MVYPEYVCAKQLEWFMIVLLYFIAILTYLLSTSKIKSASFQSDISSSFIIMHVISVNIDCCNYNPYDAIWKDGCLLTNVSLYDYCALVIYVIEVSDIQ